MDWIGKYPEDPLQTFLGENNTVSVLGQEVGHRWLAFLEFRNHTGARSEALLGRDQAHWSFFFDSDASVMEGNDIEDLGGGSFRTTAAVQRYSRLDQYAMGLVSASQVPPFFYVDNPMNVADGRQADSAPRVGVTFNGTRRDVLIDDVIAINGPRVPVSRRRPTRPSSGVPARRRAGPHRRTTRRSPRSIASAGRGRRSSCRPPRTGCRRSRRCARAISSSAVSLEPSSAFRVQHSELLVEPCDRGDRLGVGGLEIEESTVRGARAFGV